jgi:hypothetical protein
MKEQRNNGTPRNVSHRVIDWSAVGGYVLDWTFAIGELAFTILASGLVGGIFGGFIDAALVFIYEEWAGYGRMAGWTAGAVSTAIGMPLGWVRGDVKKWSLPSPRKLRKKVAAKTRKRRRRSSHDFRSVTDVVKGGGVFGLTGAVLGFFLGGALLMSWFSLAMSPFAGAEWFESLEFESAREFHGESDRRHEDGGGTVVTTNDPLAWQLFFGPVWILGGLGAVAGTLYGAANYVQYLLNVPADVREQHREKIHRPVVDRPQAIAAAIDQRLQPLAPPPRAVPIRACYRLIRDDLAIFLVGAAFFAAGVVAAILLFLGWRSNPARFPLVAVTFGLIFVAIGLLFLIATVRDWRAKMAILRRGHLTRCRIVTCKHPQTGGWRSYSTILEKLREAWDKPLADFNSKADTKSFQQIGVVFGVFSSLVFGFMGVAGVFLTAGFLYAAFVQQELVGWVGLGFLALWWTVIVWMARSIWRQTRVASTIGQQSLHSLGIKPVVECRVKFRLPEGQVVKAKTKVDLAPRLAAGKSEPDDVVAYDPWKPENALLLSGFTPPLEVGENGNWRFATSA